MIEFVQGELREARKVLDNFLTDPTQMEKVAYAAEIMVDVISKGNKILSCGNGGSHCDAMHFAEELTGRYRENRKALPAIAISDPSHISCVSNDFGYEFVFSRYLEGVGMSGDVILGISTSGNSANIINAFKIAKAKGIKSIALTGKDGGETGFYGRLGN